jgi:hypothetical protein
MEQAYFVVLIVAFMAVALVSGYVLYKLFAGQR